jgi:hypothetical protein
MNGVMGASTRKLSWQWMIEGKAVAGTEAVNVGSSAGDSKWSATASAQGNVSSVDK